MIEGVWWLLQYWAIASHEFVWMHEMRIFFSAGEPSGDQHSALLIDELRARDPEITFEGFGGPEMREHGCSLLFELTELAVMGFLRVVPLLAKFRRLVKQAEAHFDANPPDAVVLVDFPGFNWWIARAARLRGIPVFYYLPPQLWGWAPWRIKRVRKWVDHVICSLPFEYEWYRARGVRATWVGHPFFDEVAVHRLDSSVMETLQPSSIHQQPNGITEQSSARSALVGVLPGSRNHEVQKNWPVMLKAMQEVSAEIPGVRWVVGNYRESQMEICKAVMQQQNCNLPLQFFVGKTSEVIEAADCCLMVSGSISLELLARSKPGVVLYRVPRIGKMAAYFLMNCRFITLTNLIANKELMPEFISCGNPDRDIRGIADHLKNWLSDRESLDAARKAMAALAGHAAATGATRRAGELILAELSHRFRVASESLNRAA